MSFNSKTFWFIQQEWFSIRVLILVLSISGLISGCNLITAFKALRMMNDDNVHPEYMVLGDKSIIAVPMIHVGEPQFFYNVHDSVIKWKKDGYIVFYEKIILDSNDSMRLVENHTMHKWRKINGRYELYQREYYQETVAPRFKNKVVQPDYSLLGIDNTDYNADVRLDEMIQYYELLYGEVKLDSCDYAIPLDTEYPPYCGKGLDHNLKPVIIDYRNRELVNKLIKTHHTKVVVLFGAAHLKGIKKRCKSYNKEISNDKH